MSFVAHGTFNPADAQTNHTIRKLNTSAIVSVNGHAAGMTAGTAQLMKLDTINNRIILGLRNRIAILKKNGYHSTVNRHGFIHACCGNGGPDFLRVQVRCFLCYRNHDNIKGIAVNQSDAFSIRIIYAVPLFNLTEIWEYWIHTKR